MKVHFFYCLAGHGHKKAADAAAKELRKHPGIEIFSEDALAQTPAYFSQPYLSFYFFSVKYAPQVWEFSYHQSDRIIPYFGTKQLRQTANLHAGGRLLRRVIQENPDVLVHTHFFSAQLFARARQMGKIRAYSITVVTDVYPHRFWINEGTDAYWCMHEDTAEILVKRGVPREIIHTGGIPVDTAFSSVDSKEEILRRFDFDKNRFTLLLTSGSFGIGHYQEVLSHLGGFKDQIQCFVVCGNNLKLKETLEKISYPFPVRVFGFVDFMPDLMTASDLMIAKSGGLTTAESLAKGIPMIVTQPIPGQEAYNADFLKRHECSFFAQNPDQIRLILKNLLEKPGLLRYKKEAIRKIAKPNAAFDLSNFILSCPS